ncbi:MAG: phosphoglycerate dehydrogenase [Bacteroidetes bacterium]|nr:phosphoglycerate dehydrogenase [Bacteroidota bacterium]
MPQEVKKNFIIDFDSTFTKVEALDLLGEIALANHPEKEKVLNQIKEITNKGMEGTLNLRDSIEERLNILSPHKDHLNELITRLKKQVSKSFERNREFFNKYRNHIYIVSNGFKEFIVPIVSEYGIKPDHVLANEFTYDEQGNITGFDVTNALASNEGKVETIKNLDLDGDVYVIGDGYTDFEIKKAGLATKFYAFTENVSRGSVLENADHVAPSFDEFLFVHKMNTVLSYPKNRINVLLLEGIHDKAFEILKEEGYQVEILPESLDEDILCEKIKNVSVLGIRSKTNVTAKVLEHANRLIAIGAYCIGTNQINLEACQRKGVAVFNAPYGNTRSVVELAISEIIMLMRNIPDRIMEMHAGVWKKSTHLSNEIRGKKLGIIGYGNIGSQLSILAEAMSMNVFYYDIEERLTIGNAVKCQSMNELLALADVVSLHVDGRPENENMIGEKEISQMQDGAILLNLSRSNIIDTDALKKAIESGKLRGAAIDVFLNEPKTNHDTFISPLKGLPNTILTPHIGGSTQEAQMNIADYVPNVIMDFINSGSTNHSVNFPQVKLPVLENAHRLMHIHHNEPGILAKIDKVLADHKINIVGQYLKTNDIIGYVITDIGKKYPKDVIKDLKKIDHTIRVRVLY